MTEAMTDAPGLLRHCRQALGLSQAALAARLHVSGARTVQKWEAGAREIPGPVWVALRYMLREAEAFGAAADIGELLQREAA